MTDSDSGLAPKTGVIVALILVALHIGLALWYASITPYRQAGLIFISHKTPVSDIGSPDERQHANYVDHLLKGDGFPVLKPGDPNIGEEYQSHQPPAFYLLEAGWAKITGATDVTASSSGVRLRALNCFIGGATIFAVFCLGLWGFGRAEVGICAAAVAACLPMNIALSGAISNDPLLFCLCTWSLAVCAKGIRFGWNVRLGIILGVLMGLAMLTKTTSLALLPAVLVAALVSPQKPNLKVWLAVAIPMLLLPAGWWIRNQSLYGDLLAMKAFNEAFTASPQAQGFIQREGMFSYLTDWVGWWTIRSFYGAFGYMDIWLNETALPYEGKNALYRLLIVGTLLLIGGWVAYWRQSRDRETSAVQIMNLTFGVVVALLFLMFNLHYFQAQARYVYPAIGPIACAMGAGAYEVFKRKWPVALAVLLIVFGGTAIYAGTQLQPEFEKRITP